MPTFTPPTRKEYGEGPLFGRFGVQVGLSVVWNGAAFAVTPYPWLGEIADLVDGETYFLGGHIYEVSDDVAERLVNDGFDVE